MYGLQCFDSSGGLIDVNLQNALIVEGVIILGTSQIGFIPLDILFPMRTAFRGIFLMPLAHAWTAQPFDEHIICVSIQSGGLRWSVNAVTEDTIGTGRRGGAFTGKQFIYGYYN